MALLGSLVLACAVEDRLGTSRAAILDSAGDRSLQTPLCFGHHELDTVWLSLDQPPTAQPSGRWLTLFMANNSSPSPPIATGWLWSADGDALAWSGKLQSSVLEFGDPGPQPCNQDPFAGYLGDPSVAAVTDPNSEISRHGTRALFVQGSGTSGDSDHNEVVTALWDDVNHTWTNPAYVTDPSTCGRTDIPQVRSSPVWPFHTWASWWQGRDWLNDAAWIRRIIYDANGNVCSSTCNAESCPNGTCGSPIKVISASNPAYTGHWMRPNIAVGTLADLNGVPLPCTGGGEAVFVVFLDAAPDNCQKPLPNICLSDADCGMGYVCHSFTCVAPTQTDVNWYLSIYDVKYNNNQGRWYGPWLLYHDPALPNCVGAQHVTDNSNDPHIAVDTTTEAFWVVHTRGVDCGASGCYPGETRTSEVAVDYGWLGCPSVPPPHCQRGQPCPQIMHWSPPSVAATIASWNPGIAAVNNLQVVPAPPFPARRTAVYWYSTRGDPNGNTQAATWMSYSENFGPFTSPVQISAQAWPNQTALYWDYVHMGANHEFGSFLPVWNDNSGNCSDLAGSGHLRANLLVPGP